MAGWQTSALLSRMGRVRRHVGCCAAWIVLVATLGVPAAGLAQDASAGAVPEPAQDAAAVPVQESAQTSTLDQALEAYRSAQETTVPAERAAAFARAERLFTAAAVDTPLSPQLWTNIGSSALQAQHLGTAILAFRRALSLDPDHRHAQQNLTHTRTLLPAWIPRPKSSSFLDSFLARQNSLSAGERRGAGALAFLLACVMLGAAVATGSGALRFFAIVPLAAWLTLVVSAAIGIGERGGVIAAADTVARAADSRNSPSRFTEPLPAGTEVTIAEVRGDWSRVFLADGRDAWVATSAVEAVDTARE